MAALEIIKENETIAIVSPKGDIQGELADELAAALHDLQERGYRHQILDLRKTKQVDSVALSHLAAFKRQLDDVHGDVKLICAGGELPSVFSITMLDKIFEVYDNLEEAIVSYKSLAT